MDRCLWAPLVVWSERFKYDRDGRNARGRSMVLDWLTRSHFPYYWHQVTEGLSRVVRKQRDEQIRQTKRRRVLEPEAVHYLVVAGRWI